MKFGKQKSSIEPTAWRVLVVLLLGIIWGLGAAGWAELAQRQGLAGMPDARVALRRMRDEPVREAVRGVFATRSPSRRRRGPQRSA